MMEGDRRRNVSLALLVLMVALAVLSWYLNPVTQQNLIGILAGAELVAFSMVTYAYTRQRDSELKELWMLVGAAAIALLLGLAFL